MKTEIIYEDQDIIVCNKISGLAVQSARISEADMESELKTYMKRKGAASYIGVVHRLDQPVSGVMVFAKNQKAAASLSRQFASTDILHKRYEALVLGHMEAESGRLTDYLVKDAKGNMSRICSKDEKGSKKAELDYQVMENYENAQLLEIHLLTGRHHQIRVQLSGHGHSILGDRKYGNEEAVITAEKMGIKGIKLTAKTLEFTHPSTGQKMLFEYSR